VKHLLLLKLAIAGDVFLSKAIAKKSKQPPEEWYDNSVHNNFEIT
jgi:hypothetical protein